MEIDNILLHIDDLGRVFTEGVPLELPENLKQVEKDIKKIMRHDEILLQIASREPIDFLSFKEVLDAKADNRVKNLLSMWTVVGFIAATSGRIPTFITTKRGTKIVKFVSLDEARKRFEDYLTEKRVEEKAQSRISTDLKKTNVVLVEDVQKSNRVREKEGSMSHESDSEKGVS